MKNNEMIECKSCGTPIPIEEQYKTLKDGTIYKEDFCSFCLETYVRNVDLLIPDKEYAFEALTNAKSHYYEENDE